MNNEVITPAGYYADPAGSGRARYWDGYAWTHVFADEQGPIVPVRLPAPLGAYQAKTHRRMPTASNKGISLALAGVLVAAAVIGGTAYAMRGHHTSAPARTTTPVTKVTAPASVPLTPDQRFIQNLDAVDPYFVGMSSSVLVTAGTVTCSGLASGQSVGSVAYTMVNNGIPATQAGELLAASVRDFCPAYLGEVEAFAANPSSN